MNTYAEVHTVFLVKGKELGFVVEGKELKVCKGEGRAGNQ